MSLYAHKRKATLVMEDGNFFRGYAFAGEGEVYGEVVFNTGMSGYQEVLTDPSYKGQMLLMTYPLIGNYGINPQDMESAAIHMDGFILREYQTEPSNWRSDQTLKHFLESHGKIGLEGIDTRRLTRLLRKQGSMMGIISTVSDDIDELKAKVQAAPGLVGRDLVQTVTSDKPYRWQDGTIKDLNETELKAGDKLRVVVVDCGVKYNILRCLEELGCEVIVVPATTPSGAILAYEPDGIMLSNGPGDPEPVTYVVSTVRELLGKVPIFGICLGHQMLSQALGARTEKLKFGHHGLNHPVKNLRTGHIEITSHNHGFTVVTGTLPKDAEITHINLNDGTLEGIAYPASKAFSVQYHPEAAPGPKDAAYLFEDFISLMRQNRK